MAKVTKRKLPSGEIRWQFAYRDQEGKRRFKMFERKADAESYSTKVRSEIDAGTHVSPTESKTVAEAGELWLLREGPQELEASTVRQYRQHLRLHIAPRIGAVKLCDLRTTRVETFKNDLLQSMSRAMARAVLTSLKGIVTEAQRLGLVTFNGAAPVKISTKRRTIAKDLKTGAPVKIPGKDELRALVAKAAELWPLTRVETTRQREQKIVAICWRPFVVTALFTGLRCSELRGLTWDHVDLQEAVIRVRQRADFQNRIGAPKSVAGNRDVPLAPMVVNTLREWKVACPKTPGNLVFPTENGRIHSNSNIHKQCWGPLQRAAGVVTEQAHGQPEPALKPKYTFHALRHAAASLFIEQGLSPKKVQTFMGHSSIQVTFDIYGKLFPDAEADRDAMVQLEARLLHPA